MKSCFRSTAATAAFLLVLLDSAAHAQSVQSCTGGWQPKSGGEPGTNDSVTALCGFDDGGGPALYAGGVFTSAGGGSAFGIARWDGSRWSALSASGSSSVLAMASYDDGGGAALYA